MDNAGPGDILTVADDLLKNDGQKFLEMMEQLAERRMQREEEAAADIEDDSEEDEEDEGVEDEEDDEEDDEDDEEEEVSYFVVLCRMAFNIIACIVNGRAEDGGRKADVLHICCPNV